LVSDAPLGAFLSGGIDSSAIVALMSRVTNERPKTFSVVFDEAAFSEASYSRLVAKKFDAEHCEISLSEQSLLALLPSALEAMDQPTMDGINTFVISKAVKEAGVTVALSGLGGDELFAGYPSFRRAVQLNRLGAAPFAIRRFASSAGRALLNGSARGRKLLDMVESDCSPHAVYTLSRQLFSPDEIRSLVPELRPLTSGLQLPTPYTSRLTPEAPCSLLHADPINAVSWYEITGYMANTLLRDTDQMSMAHALEVRVPFVDPVVVQYALGLPGEWKMDGRYPKPLLVDVLENLLPEEVWRRAKMGFTLPFQRWMKSGLQAEVDGTLSVGNDFKELGINSDRVRAMWDTFKKNPRQEPWSRSWTLYVFNRWCNLNNVRL
jgi:asparagine synthase (glutamine-hydrolysing)